MTSRPVVPANASSSPRRACGPTATLASSGPSAPSRAWQTSRCSHSLQSTNCMGWPPLTSGRATSCNRHSGVPSSRTTDRGPNTRRTGVPRAARSEAIWMASAFLSTETAVLDCGGARSPFAFGLAWGFFARSAATPMAAFVLPMPHSAEMTVRPSGASRIAAVRAAIDSVRDGAGGALLACSRTRASRRVAVASSRATATAGQERRRLR